MDVISPIQILHTILALFILYGVWRIATSIRKINTKKISKVPKPSGAWPFIGHLHLLGRTQDPIALMLGALADKHGPIYSLKLGLHNLVVVSSWELVKECLAKNDRVFATRPSITGGKYLGYNSAIFSLAPYGQYWRDVRKMAILELLSSHRVELLSHVRATELDSFIKSLFSLCTTKSTSTPHSPVVHLSELIEQLTFNMNLRLIAGKRFSSDQYHEENSTAWRFERATKEALYLFGVFVWSDAVPFLEWLDIGGHVSAMKRCFKELDSVLGEWLEEHRQRKSSEGKNGTVESDLMDAMISNFEEEDEIAGHSRDTVIKATALVLILTGSESTAITLTWVLSLLLNNPRVLKAAQEELDHHVGRDRWVQESDIKNLKYLQAIVKETLRINPPGPITGLREATEDCYVGGYYVPKGTRLLVNIWKLQRDPLMWSDPCEFRPERFMTENADMEFRGQNFEYIPFSSGRRSCPGMTLGLHVVHLVLARLVQGFDMKREGDELVDMRAGLGLALPKATPLEAVLAPRLPVELYY
ncbi:dimethylnonatriene synthase-like [Rosa sericea]